MRARDGLTPRELEILRLIAQGLSDKLIAAELGLAPSTVSNHVSAILLKLDVENRSVQLDVFQSQR